MGFVFGIFSVIAFALLDATLPESGKQIFVDLYFGTHVLITFKLYYYYYSNAVTTIKIINFKIISPTLCIYESERSDNNTTTVGSTNSNFRHGQHMLATGEGE